jgi:hypothetical protein
MNIPPKADDPMNNIENGLQNYFILPDSKAIDMSARKFSAVSESHFLRYPSPSPHARPASGGDLLVPPRGNGIHS